MAERVWREDCPMGAKCEKKNVIKSQLFVVK